MLPQHALLPRFVAFTRTLMEVWLFTNTKTSCTVLLSEQTLPWSPDSRGQSLSRPSHNKLLRSTWNFSWISILLSIFWDYLQGKNKGKWHLLDWVNIIDSLTFNFRFNISLQNHIHILFGQKMETRPGMVVMPIIPAMQEVETRISLFKVNLRKS